MFFFFFFFQWYLQKQEEIRLAEEKKADEALRKLLSAERASRDGAGSADAGASFVDEEEFCREQAELLVRPERREGFVLRVHRVQRAARRFALTLLIVVQGASSFDHRLSGRGPGALVVHLGGRWLLYHTGRYEKNGGEIFSVSKKKKCIFALLHAFWNFCGL